MLNENDLLGDREVFGSELKARAMLCSVDTNGSKDKQVWIKVEMR